MTRITAAVLAILFSLAAFAGPEEDVDALLSRMHEASKNADVTYFDLFANDAVFFGTDLWERWSKDEFEALYKPYMESGRGWEFKMRDRRIDLQPCGTITLFDETLFSESFGPCRGSGAARLDDGEWRIVRYHLDITIPNGVVDEVVPIIGLHDATHYRYTTIDLGKSKPASVPFVLESLRPEIVVLSNADQQDIDALLEQSPDFELLFALQDDAVLVLQERFDTIEREPTDSGNTLYTLTQCCNRKPNLRILAVQSDVRMPEELQLIEPDLWYEPATDEFITYRFGAAATPSPNSSTLHGVTYYEGLFTNATPEQIQQLDE